MTTRTTGSRDRFTGRVEDYVRARPSYPLALLDDLLAAGILFPGAVVARLTVLCEAHAADGQVELVYDNEIHTGKLHAA